MSKTDTPVPTTLVDKIIDVIQQPETIAAVLQILLITKIFLSNKKK